MMTKMPLRQLLHPQDREESRVPTQNLEFMQQRLRGMYEDFEILLGRM